MLNRKDVNTEYRPDGTVVCTHVPTGLYGVSDDVREAYSAMLRMGSRDANPHDKPMYVVVLPNNGGRVTCLTESKARESFDMTPGAEWVVIPPNTPPAF